jgi:hypothetical protein
MLDPPPTREYGFGVRANNHALLFVCVFVSVLIFIVIDPHPPKLALTARGVEQ